MTQNIQIFIRREAQNAHFTVFFYFLDQMWKKIGKIAFPLSGGEILHQRFFGVWPMFCNLNI